MKPAKTSELNETANKPVPINLSSDCKHGPDLKTLITVDTNQFCSNNSAADPEKMPPRNTRMPREPSRTVERSAMIKCLH